MSHHFDTKLAKEDPSLNLCDFYLFGKTPALLANLKPEKGKNSIECTESKSFITKSLDVLPIPTSEYKNPENIEKPTRKPSANNTKLDKPFI